MRNRSLRGGPPAVAPSGFFPLLLRYARFFFIVVVVILVFAGTTNSATLNPVVELKDENFDELTMGKHVFVMFYHRDKCKEKCDSIKPSWVKLATKFKNSENVLIADIECQTIDPEEHRLDPPPTAVLCEDYHDYDGETKGGMALHYGDPQLMQLYTTDLPTDYDSLEKHIEEKRLDEPFCSVAQIEKCNEMEKQVIEKYKAMSLEELRDILDEVEDKLELIEQDFMTTSADAPIPDDIVLHQMRTAAIDIYAQYHWNFVHDIVNEKDPPLTDDEEDADFDDEFYSDEEGEPGEWSDDEDEDGDDYDDDDDQDDGYGDEF